MGALLLPSQVELTSTQATPNYFTRHRRKIEYLYRNHIALQTTTLTKKSIKMTSGNQDIILQDLSDFDVHLGINVEHQTIEIVDVTGIVSDWMSEGFVDCLQDGGWAISMYAEFEKVILLERKSNRRSRLLSDEDKCKLLASCIGY